MTLRPEPEVVRSAQQVTPAWLTHALQASGALVRGQVTAVETQIDERELSTSIWLRVAYSEGAEGSRPPRLFLKLVTLSSDDDAFGPSEVNYYWRDYASLSDAPIPYAYDAVYSEAQGGYHILMDDLSVTHLPARGRTPTRAYGYALAESLAALHAHWCGAGCPPRPAAAAIRRFAGMGQHGADLIIKACAHELKAHWPSSVERAFSHFLPLLIERTTDARGFTLIHGDVHPGNILVPATGERPLFLVDRQPFTWSLTTWLGVYDLAYALILYWPPELRRAHEEAILRHYHTCLVQRGVADYSWAQLWNDYRLCAVMGIYVASEWCRTELRMDTHPYWMPMLQRTLVALDDLRCMELLRA